MTKAQPGDKIIITNRTRQELAGMYGKIYTVVPCEMLSLGDDLDNYAWITHKYSDNHPVLHEDYKIVNVTRSFSEPPKEIDLFVSQGVLDDIHSWVNDPKVKKIAAMIGQSPCPDCKGTGRIELLTSTVDCDCVKNTITKKEKGCPNCWDECCECDGTCDEGDSESCVRCHTWVCANCVIDGYCSNCFSKLQGGVN